MIYYLKFLNHKAFKIKPGAVLKRAFLLVFLLIFRKSTIITIQFGNDQFRFEFIPKARNSGGRGIYLYREHIEPLMQFGHLFLERGDSVFDGGANQGVFTAAFAAAVGPSGKVIAVEPFDYCHECIKQNAIINDFRSIRHYKAVLTSRHQICQLDYTAGVGKSSITRDFGATRTISIQGTTIDNIIKENDDFRLNLLKLDIEGAEADAIDGSINSIKKFQPIIVIECTAQTFEAIYLTLKKIGYHAYILGDDGSLESISSIIAVEDNVFFLTAEQRQRYLKKLKDFKE